MAKAIATTTVNLSLSQDEANALACVLSMVTCEGISPAYVSAMGVFDTLVEEGGARWKSVTSSDFPFVNRSRLTFKDQS